MILIQKHFKAKFTRFLEDFAEHPGSDGGHLAGLDDDHVPCDEGWGDLEGQQVEGQVPGADEAS